MVNESKTMLTLPPGMKFRCNIEQAGLFLLQVLGSTVWYLPGPGVLARSSENPPVFARLVIEKQAEEPLFGTFGPRSGGRVYELGEGVASPKSKKVMLTPYSQVLCKVVSLMSLSVQFRQAPSKLGCYYCGVFINNFGD